MYHILFRVFYSRRKKTSAALTIKDAVSIGRSLLLEIFSPVLGKEGNPSSLELYFICISFQGPILGLACRRLSVLARGMINGVYFRN